MQLHLMGKWLQSGYCGAANAKVRKLWQAKSGWLAILALNFSV
jgi:hypothetical protein